MADLPSWRWIGGHAFVALFGLFVVLSEGATGRLWTSAAVGLVLASQLAIIGRRLWGG